jgi:glucose/mannose-6-phosphate isomerase
MPEKKIILDENIKIKDLDKSSMYSNLYSIAKDTLKSYDKAKKDLNIKNNRINNIIGAGMGGAGMPLLALQHLLKDELNFPYVVSQNYTLPNFANSNTALIAISQSGKSEEIISQYRQAINKDVKIIVIEKEDIFEKKGTLIKMANNDGIPCFSYSSNVPARASFGFMFGSVLAFLENIGAISSSKREAIFESIGIVEKLNKNIIGIDIPNEDNKAKQIALSLKNQIPVLYVEPPFGSLGSRFAKMFNENVGMFAFYNYFPELRHNEIMSWIGARNNYNSKFVPILLRDNKEYSKMEEEINEIKEVIARNVENYSNFIEIRAEGKSKIARFFYLLHYADMISYYSAILIDKDPSDTKDLEELKTKLRTSGCLRTVLNRHLDKEFLSSTGE